MNILFTSVGNLAFPLIYNELKVKYKTNFRLIGTDIRDSAHGLYYCDKSYITCPRTSSRKFISQINQIIKENNIKLIYPLSTDDQEFFSLRVNYFKKKNVKVLTSNLKSLIILGNKQLLYDTFRQRKLTPNIFHLDNIKRIMKSDSKFTFVIKKFHSTGAKGTFIISNNPNNLANEDVKFYLDTQTFFKNVNKYFNSNYYLICEYLPKSEYSVDVLCYNGKFYYGVVRERFKSIGGLALECRTIENKELLDKCKLIIAKLKLSYIVNIQFKCDIENNYKLIDINARIPGTLQLSCDSGGNYINDAISLALGRENIKVPKFIYNMYHFRYWSGITVDFSKINCELVKL